MRKIYFRGCSNSWLRLSILISNNFQFIMLNGLLAVSYAGKIFGDRTIHKTVTLVLASIMIVTFYLGQLSLKVLSNGLCG